MFRNEINAVLLENCRLGLSRSPLGGRLSSAGGHGASPHASSGPRQPVCKSPLRTHVGSRERTVPRAPPAAGRQSRSLCLTWQREVTARPEPPGEAAGGWCPRAHRAGQTAWGEGSDTPGAMSGGACSSLRGVSPGHSPPRASRPLGQSRDRRPQPAGASRAPGRGQCPRAQLGSREQGLEDGNDRVLVRGHHQDAAELVHEREQLRAPRVLVVHDLLQVVAASEVVQKPGVRGGRRAGQTRQATSARRGGPGCGGLGGRDLPAGGLVPDPLRRPGRHMPRVCVPCDGGSPGRVWGGIPAQPTQPRNTVANQNAGPRHPTRRLSVGTPACWTRHLYHGGRSATRGSH